MSLSDQNSSVVDGFGKALLKHLCLESPLHKSLRAQFEYVIQRIFLFSHKSKSLQSTDKRWSFKKALRILFIKSQ